MKRRLGKFGIIFLALAVALSLGLGFVAQAPAVSADSNVTVKLLDSNGGGLSGGTVQYYDSGWKTAGSTDASGVCTFTYGGSATKLSIKMTYAGYTQQKSNVDISSTNPLVFTTVKMQVKLEDSSSNGLKGGVVKYYASGWKSFGITGDDGNTPGVELLPGKYSFKMTYAGYTQQKSNVDITLAANNPLIFQTVNMVVRLEKGADHSDIQGGVVKYYASGWKAFGTTESDGNTPGVELLPGKYSFKMTYAGYTQQKSNVDITTTNPLIFQTKNMVVRLEKCDHSGLKDGEVKYYASGWKSFGITGDDGNTPGVELLPGKYSFKMTYAGYTQQKSNINISNTNPLIFQTTTVTLQFSGTIKYYASGWKTFTSPMELLPYNYSFRFDGYQTKINVSGCSIKQSVLLIRLKDSTGAPLLGGKAYLGVGGWPYIGDTDAKGVLLYFHNGLLSNMRIRMTAPNYGGTQTSPSQDMTVNSVFNFQTAQAVIQLKDSADTLTDGGVVRIGFGGWPIIGTTGDNGTGTLYHELFPGTYTFRMSYNYGTEEKQQDIGTPVIFQTALVDLQFSGTIKHKVGGWPVYSGPTEMLPVSHGFAFTGCSYGRQVLWFTPTAGTLFEKSIVFLSFLDGGGNGLADGDFDYRIGYGPRTTIGTTDSSGLIVYAVDGIKTNVKFRVQYAGAALEKQQNIATDSCVVFQTVPVTAVLNNSAGNPINSGVSFKYRYSFDTYHPFTSPMELLPVNTKVQVYYAGTSVENQQNVGTNANFVFQTVPVTAVLNDSDGNPITSGVSFRYRYSFDTYHPFISPMELLPVNTKVRVYYAGTSVENQQNVGTNANFVFQTVPVTAVLNDSDGKPITSGVSFRYRYSYDPYQTFTSPMELLPVNTKVRVYYAGTSVENQQNVGTNANFVFQTGNVVSDSGTCTYYRYGYNPYQPFSNGMELLPVSTKFKFSDGTAETSYTIAAGIFNHIH